MTTLSKALTVDDWDLILTDTTTGQTATLHPDQRDRFWADPFLRIDDAGCVHILCEEFDYRTNLGTAVELVLDDAMRVRSVTPMLATNGHESYPFPFVHDGTTYCIPETSHLGQVLLFRLDAAGWEMDRVLLPDFAGLDSTLHTDGAGDHWLFTTPLTDPHSLHLWHAPELEGPWQPHRSNPVVSTVRGGRQAGRILPIDDALIRSGQNSADRYGGSIVQFEITELSLDRYCEIERNEIEPPAGYDGIHTIDQVAHLHVVDAARRTSVLGHPSFVQWRARKSLGRL